jgi:CRP/FNR family transcriptional activator FtrB
LRPHETEELRQLPLLSAMSPESMERLLDAALLQKFPAASS